MHFEFAKGDIVKFIDEANVRPDYLHNIENIFQIVSVEGSTVKLSRSFFPIMEADLSTITAVKMDGQEDKHIYYDPVIMASIVWSCDPVPVHNKDYTYYLDAQATFATIKPCVILLPKMGLGMFTNFNIIFVNTINRMI